MIRVQRLQLCLERLRLRAVGAAVCHLDPHFLCLFVCVETVFEICLHGVKHGCLCLLHRSRLGKSIQLLALDLQHRLDPKQGAKRRCRRCDSAALFQIFQRIHGDVNAGIKFRAFQIFPDLRRALSLFGQCFRVQHRLPLGNGNPLVVHHLYFAVKILGQHDGRLAGAAEAAGHGNVHDLVVLLQQAVPQIHHISHRGLRSGNIRISFQLLIKIRLGQIDILIK